MRYRLFLMALSVALMAGCEHAERSKSTASHSEGLAQSTSNPTAQGMIKRNADADLFQWNGIVYVNASDIEWVQEADLTPGKSVGIIKKTYEAGIAFEDGMATKLPVHTEVFEPIKKNGLILIVKVHDKEIRYLGLVEG
ncbi:hypothetical protein WMW72_24050 [Paenibacillus filicis]|uniref:Lipoprotein n=1 Tax=Paenibacillus filicis TaxID=669464 RepID=A0ABU9DQ58_9BACL